jgi:LytS/YehU family sensor histidine kinase
MYNSLFSGFNQVKEGVRLKTFDNMFIGILIVSMVLLILVITTVVVMMEAKRKHLAAELSEANYKAKISDVTFAALRSQMNPHFIFNCLNSIKYFTEQNNNEAASAYLSKFAGLIRSTLDNARCEKITLEEEMASLQLYLELEAMRFKEKLQYSIMINENVDTEFIELPPMIVQPYIENAIWHGLMAKEEGGLLTVKVSQDQLMVYITINDNGIGRAKAAEMKTKHTTAYTSYGTKITADRIAMLNDRAGEKVAEVNVVDEYDGNNLPCGTTVTIQLPIK